MVLLKSNENKELDVIREMFEEIMKLIREKQIRTESILSQVIEREMITQDSFDRMYNLLIEFGRKKSWIK